MLAKSMSMMGNTSANSTSCVPRSRRAKRIRRKMNVLAKISVASSLIEHGDRHLHAGIRAVRIVAAAADDERLLHVLGLVIAARTIAELRPQEEETEAMEADDTTPLIELALLDERNDDEATIGHARMRRRLVVAGVARSGRAVVGVGDVLFDVRIGRIERRVELAAAVIVEARVDPCAYLTGGETGLGINRISIARLFAEMHAAARARLHIR